MIQHKNIHKKTSNFKKGQSTIEFTFAMVAVALLIYGVIKVFQWVGMEYAQKAYTQQSSTILEDHPRPQRLTAFTRKF